MTRAPRLVLLAVAITVAAAAPSTASASGWTCSASAVRATVLTGPPVEPVTANAGAPDCRDTSAGAATPAGLPVPLTLGALDASTSLENPAGAVATQTAHAAGGMVDLRVQALPGLPIALPLPDLSQFAHVQLPGGIEVDLRPAIQALIQPRQIPGIDLLRVQLARAEATASCAGGAPRLSGTSTLNGVSVNGQPIDVNAPVTRTVQLIDSQQIDPNQVSPVPGLHLPTITVPAVVARVKLTPGERVETGVRLTERALHAQISIAGQNVADVVAGEATVGSAGVSCGGVADLALECTARRIVLIDVKIQGSRVRLLGAADRRYAGRRIRIRSSWDGRTVARPRLSATGLFHATAQLPPPKVRPTNDARYQASVGGQRSLDLKLVRRMIVTSTSRHGATVRIVGRVTQPLASPVRAIEVRRRVSCSRWAVVKRFKPRADGRFSVALKAPAEGQAAAYRMHTKVRLFANLPKLFPTFTLPRYVDLG